MLRGFSILIAALLLGGCYSPYKAAKQVNKALYSYPQIVAKIALDSFPCDVIRIDTIISVRDSIVECSPIENFSTLMQSDTVIKKIFVKLPVKTMYITKTVESTAKLTIINASLDSITKVTTSVKKTNEHLTSKISRKNKVIFWLIVLLFGASIPFIIRVVRYITLI
jgi:hypothetical protein